MKLYDDLIGWNFVDDNNNPWDQSGSRSVVVAEAKVIWAVVTKSAFPWFSIMSLLMQ